MDVKRFMDKDLHQLETIIKDLSENITKWDTDKVYQQTMQMFGCFSRRFWLEDELLSKVTPSAEAKPTIDAFLKRRRGLRESLEGALKLHVDEPEFRTEVGAILKRVAEHAKYREQEFYPQFVDKLSPAESASLSEKLEDSLVTGSAK
jgi:hypothetical protein